MTKRGGTSAPCLPCRQKTLDNRISTISTFIDQHQPIGFAIGGILLSAVRPTYRWFGEMQFSTIVASSGILDVASPTFAP